MEHGTIIIGSGIAGLATAARLAFAGRPVLVFEANPYAGGKISLKGNSDYRFDAGPSLFTLPHLVDDVFVACGKDPRDYFNYHKRKVACRYFWEDGTQLTAWGDRNKFAEEVERILDVPGQQVLDYLQMSAHIYKTTTPVFLEKSLHRLKSYLNAETLRAVLQMHRLHLTGSLHQLNQKKLSHPKLVQLFDRFATYNGSSPYLTPGVMSSIPHLEHNIGTYYPQGGMYQITQSLYQLCQELGVEFHFKEKVTKIATLKGRATGVETKNGFYPAETVVSNMDIVPTYRQLLIDEEAPEKVLNQARSSSALIFYWGIQKVFPELDLHNIFFSNDYQKEFKAIFEDQTVYNDPTVYVNISSKVESSDAPESSENWFVMINVPGNTGQDWDSIIKKVRQLTLTKLNKVLNVNLQDLIEYEEVLEPRTIEAETSSYQGSLYGASSNNKMAAFLRYPNFSPKIKDLYFCGGSVHPGGGIPLCLLGAKITSEIIMEKTKWKN